jgi:hypothetical protein
MSFLINIVLVLEVCVALGAHEVRTNLMMRPHRLAFMAPTVFDVGLASFAVEVRFFQMIVENSTAMEIYLAVWADIMMA